MFNWKTITLALLAASEIQFVNAYVPSNIILPSAIGASIVKIVAEANNPASNVKVYFIINLLHIYDANITLRP